jgi:TetR/AcrR family transcriptional regulator, transcriptional repressor for nem operon
VNAPLDRLKKHAEHEVEFQAELKRKHKHVLGCPAVSLGAEIGTMEEALRQKLCSVIAAFQRYYESAIRDAQRLGQIEAGDPAVMARRISAYVEGTLTLARIHNDLSLIAELPDGVIGILGVIPARRKAA